MGNCEFAYLTSASNPGALNAPPLAVRPTAASAMAHNFQLLFRVEQEFSHEK